MTYDKKCYDLAVSFAEDFMAEKMVPSENMPTLHVLAHECAREIQRAIEGYFENQVSLRMKREPAHRTNDLRDDL